MTEGVVERPQRHTPQLIPVGTVGQQAEILKEHVGVPAVRGRTGGDRAVGGPFDHLLARARGFAPPQDLAGSPVQRDGEELLVLDRGRE